MSIMHEDSENGRSMVSVRTMEIVTALAIIVFAAAAMASNYELGAGWGSNGPESGYFPFYVGLILLISGVAILIGEAMKAGPDGAKSFVESRPLVRVLQIVIPTLIYVVLIANIGLYLSTALFISLFMVWLGRYRVITGVLIGIGVAVMLFLTFEVWFLVPLPKGPVAALFGY